MSIVKAHYIYSVGIISSCCRASLRFIFLCDGHRSQAALKKASMDITASVSFWKGLLNSTVRQLKQSNYSVHLNVRFFLLGGKNMFWCCPPSITVHWLASMKVDISQKVSWDMIWAVYSYLCACSTLISYIFKDLELQLQVLDIESGEHILGHFVFLLIKGLIKN